MSDQTHCPGCGLHKTAVNVIEHRPDGGWTCGRCLKVAAMKANPPPPPAGTPVPHETVPCPDHSGASCGTCGGYGVVRVPANQLKTYDPSAKRVLTEG